MNPDKPETWLQNLRGVFLAFEGGDGSGKSTQLRRFVALCIEQQVPLCEVREPGGSEVGERIRQVLLDKAVGDMSLRCEMLLYMASRAQLVEKKIRPAMAQGRLVIADRFVASTFAYQGNAGGLPETEIRAAASVACGTTFPDLNIIFDVDETTAAKRAGIISSTKGKKADTASGSLFADRMEDRDALFRCKVRQSYLAQAKADPGHFAVIDASKSPEEVWESLMEALCRFCASRKP